MSNYYMSTDLKKSDDVRDPAILELEVLRTSRLHCTNPLTQYYIVTIPWTKQMVLIKGFKKTIIFRSNRVFN
jgi:hypothetical protein